MRRASTMLAVLVLALAGCGDDDEPVSAGGGGGDGGLDLAGEYLSTEVIADGAPRPLVDGTRISLRFEDGQLGANAGCNHLGGTYTLDGDVLRVGQMGGTEMGCDPPRHDQDQWLTEFLTSTPTVTAADDGFTLATDTTTVRFVDREVAEPDAELIGTTWVVTGFIDGDVASSTTSDAGEATLELAEDGTLTGFDGCNDYATTYEVDGDTLIVSDGASVSDAMCEQSSQQQEQVRSIIGQEVTWSIDAQNLTLLAPDGSGVTYTAGG